MTNDAPPGTRARERAAKIHWIETTATELDTGCRDWPWAAKTRQGYGQVWLNGGMRLVGHLVLEMSGRPRPSDDHQQLHSCDRPSCAAPWHLRWGLNEENVADKVERGRTAGQPGVENNNAILTDAAVLAIRASGESNGTLAARYRTARSNISMIRNGRRWAHVQ